ncbi:MAG: hypothetical protein KIT18_12310 [Burkholderiales bacterium]|nr:hypothetical protein [Burkholderiales bacterium]
MAEARADREGVRLRLLPVRPPSIDPGFEGMISDGPQSFDALIGALRMLADEYEQGSRLDEVPGGTPQPSLAAAGLTADCLRRNAGVVKEAGTSAVGTRPGNCKPGRSKTWGQVQQ